MHSETITGVGTVRRIGNIVMYTKTGANTLTAGSVNSIGTIPSGYRPIAACYAAINCVNSNEIGPVARISVTTEGAVTIVTSSNIAQEYFATMTWITSDDMPD